MPAARGSTGDGTVINEPANVDLEKIEGTTRLATDDAAGPRSRVIVAGSMRKVGPCGARCPGDSLRERRAGAVGTIVLAVGAAAMVYRPGRPPAAAHRKTHSPPVRRFLERVVATPSLLGEFVRLDAAITSCAALADGNPPRTGRSARTEPYSGTLRSSPSFVAGVRGTVAPASSGAWVAATTPTNSVGSRPESLKEVKRDAAWYLTRGRQLTTREDHAGGAAAPLRAGTGRRLPPGP